MCVKEKMADHRIRTIDVSSL